MHDSFDALGLLPALMRAVSEQGYTVPTPVQAQAIPIVLAGHDVLAGAQTGTGKTAAFTLPLLQRLASRMNTAASPAKHPVRALVLAPTRELAAQIHASVAAYARHLPIRSTVVYGGVGMQPQLNALRRGVDVLVATPGRLLDHIQQKSVELSRVEILVLDEADRMLDMGFIRDIRRILAVLPAMRQNLLFSATFSTEIRRLADDLLRNPVAVEVARRNVEADSVRQRVHLVVQEQKREALTHIVRTGAWSQVLVFTRTKHGANRLADHLQRDGISAVAIHGNKSQPQRTKALAEFKQGEVRVLVATDIAARGIDIEALPHVVNFDLPHVAEDYVHRIGRTGRAGLSGEAISLVSPEERSDLMAIERLIGRRIEQQPIAGLNAVPARADAARSRAAPPQQRDEAIRSHRRSSQPQRTRPKHSAAPSAAVSSSSELRSSRQPLVAPGARTPALPVGALLGGTRSITEEV